MMNISDVIRSGALRLARRSLRVTEKKDSFRVTKGKERRSAAGVIPSITEGPRNNGALRLVIAFAALMLALAPGAQAQYQQIPNFTGIGAGYNFRQAINARLGGAAAIAPQIVSSPIANLPPEQDGLVLWCRDCVKTTPCAGGGGGAWALGARGAWSCSGGALEEDLNANGHNLLDAASVNAANAGDINPRESLVAGLGLRMSNGTAAPYTVIDEEANVTAHVNGVINVKAPPYNAKGDGVTDDWNAIQSAIYASCGGTPPASQNPFSKAAVYLPATPSPGCYSISQPLDITCPYLKFYGVGGSAVTNICANFAGPALRIEPYVAGTAPLISNVTAAWQASHSYSAVQGNYSEIKDSNGNIELASVGGTSGATQPSWPVTQGSLTADGTVTWALTVVGSSLATGTGSALDGSGGTAGNTNNPIVDLGYEPATNLTGLPAFTAEAFVEIAQTATNTGGGQLGQFVGSIPMNPSTNSNPNGGAFELGATNPSGGNSYAYCEMNTGGTVHTLTGVTAMTLYKTHFEECSYDGTNIRLFLDGNLETTQAATGTIQQGYYETVQTFYHGGSWPDQSLDSGGGAEYVDSVRLLNSADHTASYAAPTAKLTSTSNTLILLNFPTTAPFGTIQAQNGTRPETVYIPYVMSGNQMGTEDIEGINFCPSGRGGLFASGIVNSTFRNLSCGLGTLVGFYFNNNDYEDRMINVSANGYPPSSQIAGHTVAGIVIGAQGNDNTYDDLFCSGVSSCVVQMGGSGVYTKPVFSDFGSGVYPFVFEGAQFNIRHPFTDIEDNNPNFISDVYSRGSWAPGLIDGGELDATNSGGNAGPFTIVGGAPLIVRGTAFGGGTPTQIFDVLTSPTTPITIEDPEIQYGTPPPLTNSGHASDVYMTAGGKITGIEVNSGINFANFPGTVINGASFYCPNCDPPANPPVTCSSAGAKTGAWVHGIDSAWICTY